MDLFNVIKKGLQNGLIQIIDDMGIRCSIGEYSFYFVGIKDCDLSIEEYFKAYTEDMTANMIFEILKTDETAEENGVDSVERSYYLDYLGLE